MSVTSTPKTHTAGSQTWGSGMSDSARGARRRRTKLATEKKIADDEFMAAAIGDVEWLKQSLRDAGPDVNFDKNVSFYYMSGKLSISVGVEKLIVHIQKAVCVKNLNNVTPTLPLMNYLVFCPQFVFNFLVHLSLHEKKNLNFSI